MEWYKVHDEAEQLEHAVSAEFEKKLQERLGNEEACPHGNRVGLDRPKDRRDRGWLPLAEVQPNGHAQVMSVFERDRQLLEYLNALGIRPGANVQLVARNYDQTVTLKVAKAVSKAPVQLGSAAAAKVWVLPARNAVSPTPTSEKRVQ
ncbi:MAG: metal-dependent transcriptional regulator, partial [Acidobacteriota bacterium]